MHKSQRELARTMHANNPEYHAYEYDDMLRVLRATIIDEIMQGQDVNLPGVGFFSLKVINPKSAYNFQLKKTVDFPKSYNVKFRPSITFKKELQETMREAERANESKEANKE